MAVKIKGVKDASGQTTLADGFLFDKDKAKIAFADVTQNGGANDTNLTSALNSKANSSHTHETTQIEFPDGVNLNTAFTNLTNTVAGKANASHTHAATSITVEGDYSNLQEKLNCCQVFSIQDSTDDINVDDIFKNHISEQTAVGEDAICVEVCVSSESKKISQILTGSDRGFFFLNGCGDIIPKGDGAFVRIYGFSATNYIVALSSNVYDTTPTAGSKNLLTSGSVATALAGKAASKVTSAGSTINIDALFVGSGMYQIKWTNGDNDIQLNNLFTSAGESAIVFSSTNYPTLTEDDVAVMYITSSGDTFFIHYFGKFNVA